MTPVDTQRHSPGFLGMDHLSSNNNRMGGWQETPKVVQQLWYCGADELTQHSKWDLSVRDRPVS